MSSTRETLSLLPFLNRKILRAPGIDSFCIHNRLRQMAFFSSSPKLAKAGQRPAFALC